MHNLVFLALLLGTLSLPAQVRYVSPTGAGNMDGSSWSDASADLQAMINAAAAGQEVWVAAGTYRPTTQINPNEPRSKSFVMKEGVGIYGGFVGTETQRSARDWTANATTLSGDLNGDDAPVTVDAAGRLVFANNNENGYNVVKNDQNGLTAAAVLDGFILRAGNSAFNSSRGGGMYNNNASPSVVNCIFSNNQADIWGGGMYNEASSSPTVINCTFSGNRANLDGGGIYNLNSLPTVINCRFLGNQVNGSGGGGYNNNSSVVYTNCTFSGNRALEYGGGMQNAVSSSSFTNCSFSGNRARFNGGAVGNFSTSNPAFTNCLIYNNQEASSTTTSGASVADLSGSSSTFTYSLVQNITSSANNNLDGSLDPLFVTPVAPATAPTTAGNLRLQSSSPAIDAGNNMVNVVALDLAGNIRITDGNNDSSADIDLGAYEAFSLPPCTPNTTPDPTSAPLTWTGAVSSAWNEGCNWSSERVPDADNPVTVPGGTPNAPALQAGAPYAATALTLQSGVQLTLPVGSSFDIGGTLLLDGATLTNEGTLDPGAVTLQNGGVLTNRGRVE